MHCYKHVSQYRLVLSGQCEPWIDRLVVSASADRLLVGGQWEQWNGPLVVSVLADRWVLSGRCEQWIGSLAISSLADDWTSVGPSCARTWFFLYLFTCSCQTRLEIQCKGLKCTLPIYLPEIVRFLYDRLPVQCKRCPIYLLEIVHFPLWSFNCSM